MIEQIEGAALRDRRDPEDEASDVDLGADARALAGTVRATLDADSAPDDGDAMDGPTRVSHPDDSDDLSVPSFCPSCGAALAAWSGVSFCSDCGRDLST